MKINRINNSQSFGSLRLGRQITEKLARNRADNVFVRELNSIKKIITDNKLDQKKYVDIELRFDELFGKRNFFALISPKDADIPIHPDNKHFIFPDKKNISNFQKWINSWNLAYAPQNRNIQDEKKAAILSRLIKRNQSAVL